MKDRSYLQATIVNGRNGERIGKKKKREGMVVRTSEKHHKGTNPSNRPVGPGNDSLLSIRSPICAIFILTPAAAKEVASSEFARVFSSNVFRSSRDL